MNRRKFTIGLASLAAGSAAAIGTGAFTSIEADRGLRIDVADDADAFLGMEGDGEYVQGDGGDTLFFNLGEETNSTGGEGFNDRAETHVPDVVTLTNQGTTEVRTGFGGNPQNEVEFEFPAQGDSNPILVTLTIDVDDRDITPGKSATISATVDTTDDNDVTDPGDDVQSLTVSALDTDQLDDDDDDNGGVGG